MWLMPNLVEQILLPPPPRISPSENEGFLHIQNPMNTFCPRISTYCLLIRLLSEEFKMNSKELMRINVNSHEYRIHILASVQLTIFSVFFCISLSILLRGGENRFVISKGDALKEMKCPLFCNLRSWSCLWWLKIDGTAADKWKLFCWKIGNLNIKRQKGEKAENSRASLIYIMTMPHMTRLSASLGPLLISRCYGSEESVVVNVMYL